MTAPGAALVRRGDIRLPADPRRVAARLFLPGQEPGAPGSSRAAGVVARCCALDDTEVADALGRIEESFGGRHVDLHRLLEEHFTAIEHRVPAATGLDAARRRLIGAYFTREVSIESAALFNPSVVVHPVQDGGPGTLRFVMSVRAVSEGHLSVIGFRSGTLVEGPAGPCVVMDPTSPYVDGGTHHEAPTGRERLRRDADLDGTDPETRDAALEHLPDTVGQAELDAAVERLRHEELTRTAVEPTIAALRRAMTASYSVTFGPESALSSRTLFPQHESESHGVEDARFVRVEDGEHSRWSATYTGFNGSAVVSRRLDTTDFRTFTSSSMTGVAAGNKGMALFPRTIGGRHHALSRWDRENNAVAASADGYHWDDVVQLQAPVQPWELTQLGNCGSPIETGQGWLVLTHGVGAMRAYALGALLLDLDDPSVVVGRLTEPLLEPAADERDGYVPNVVYTCGGLVHGNTLLLPYGCSDTEIRIGLVDLPELLDRLTR